MLALHENINIHGRPYQESDCGGELREGVLPSNSIAYKQLCRAAVRFSLQQNKFFYDVSKFKVHTYDLATLIPRPLLYTPEASSSLIRSLFLIHHENVLYCFKYTYFYGPRSLRGRQRSCLPASVYAQKMPQYLFTLDRILYCSRRW